MGVRSGQLSVTGSIKYDLTIADETRKEAAALRETLGTQRPVWIGASTHEGEDARLLEAHCTLLATNPDALLVLVPRHPERFNDVAQAVQDQNLVMARRSRAESAAKAQVYLADTMGELLMLFGSADIAFIGGSLIERGGHNPLEAAAWSLPVLTGPHVFNFATVFEYLSQEDGVLFVEGEDALARSLQKLFGDETLRRETGQRARAVVEANQGAVARLVEGISRRCFPVPRA